MDRNQVTLLGYIKHPPEQSQHRGRPVVVFGLSTKVGEISPMVYHRILTVGVCATQAFRLKAQTRALVIGRIVTDTWTDLDGTVHTHQSILADTVVAILNAP